MKSLPTLSLAAKTLQSRSGAAYSCSQENTGLPWPPGGRAGADGSGPRTECGREHCPSSATGPPPRLDAAEQTPNSPRGGRCSLPSGFLPATAGGNRTGLRRKSWKTRSEAVLREGDVEGVGDKKILDVAKAVTV